MLDTITLTKIEVEDIRFRFAQDGPGSDANNPKADYSNPLITICSSQAGLTGVGIGFTLGRGNDLVCRAVRDLAPLLEGRSLEAIIANMATVTRALANPLQARWLGPNCGVYYMAAGALLNAVFDLWAKAVNKPLWRLLADLSPDELVGMLDLRYVAHLLSAEEAVNILRAGRSGRKERLAQLEAEGLPCYFTTWIGTGTEALMEQIAEVRRNKGIGAFKLKVGRDLSQDRERLAALRSRFGDALEIMTDANQVWSVAEAVHWMQALADYNITWIEEPTAPDSVDGHRLIREGLQAAGIEVVTGEQCQNAHMAGQFIAGGSVDRFQIDACRVLGPLEDVVIMLIAAKYDLPVCPHAGGSGLDELVPHLAAWNYLACQPSLDRVRVEQVGFCSDYFLAPSRIEAGRIRLPHEPGYLVGMRDEAKREFRFSG